MLLNSTCTTRYAEAEEIVNGPSAGESVAGSGVDEDEDEMRPQGLPPQCVRAATKAGLYVQAESS
jgi:hypothetical protein